jgi:hypothetical protein
MTLEGRFSIGRVLDLETATGVVTVVRLLGAMGSDLVGDTPLRLLANPRNNARSAIYETQAGAPVAARIMVDARPVVGEYKFKLTLRDASIAVPTTCPTAELRTIFTVGDGFLVPALVDTEASWQCLGSKQVEVLRTH